VRLDDHIAADARGLSATCALVPTPGLAMRPARWPIFLSWQASTFTPDVWHNPYVPLTVWFDSSRIDAALGLVSRLHVAEPDIDHSQRVRNFLAKAPHDLRRQPRD
jgi:hypothetical protein